jgi:hypothetical protein
VLLSTGQDCSHYAGNRSQFEPYLSLLGQCYTFKRYVCAESYEDEPKFLSQRQNLEVSGPDHRDSERLISHSSLLRAVTDDRLHLGSEWKRCYLAVVQEYQMRVNHHIHLPNDQGTREPMPYCRSKTNHADCTKGYPKKKYEFQHEKGAAVCRGLAKKLNFNISGRRCMLGAIACGRDNEWLNGTHPVLLANLHCNSDVLVPYRLPLMPETHSKEMCDIEGCIETQSQADIMFALEQSQRDQIGYITDYVTKRQPIAINEIDRFVRGHRQLLQQLHGASLTKSAVRHTQRLLSDVLGRGTVRKAVECTNLLVCRKKHDVTAAESVKSHLLVAFPCGDYMSCQVSICNNQHEKDGYEGMEVDARDPENKVYVSKVKVPMQYGHRGSDPELLHLTPHEFHSLWSVERAMYPMKPARDNENIYHAKLTPQGELKVKQNSSRNQKDSSVLEAGTDYIIRSNHGHQRDRRYE